MALLLLVATFASAQQREISGVLVDGDSKEAVPMVTVQLLKMDSTFVVGAVTNDSGRFVLRAPANEKYIVKMSSIGYITTTKRVQMEGDHNLRLGVVTIK